MPPPDPTLPDPTLPATDDARALARAMLQGARHAAVGHKFHRRFLLLGCGLQYYDAVTV